MKGGFALNFDNFIDTRIEKNGLYKLVLEMAAHEYYDD